MVSMFFFLMFPLPEISQGVCTMRMIISAFNEMTGLHFPNYLHDGLCGNFYLQWVSVRLRVYRQPEQSVRVTKSLRAVLLLA